MYGTISCNRMKPTTSKVEESLTFKVVPLGQQWAAVNCHQVISSQLFCQFVRWVGDKNQNWGSVIPLVNIHLLLFVADFMMRSPQVPTCCSRVLLKHRRGGGGMLLEQPCHLEHQLMISLKPQLYSILHKNIINSAMAISCLVINYSADYLLWVD